MNESIKLSDFLVLILEKLNFDTCFGVTGGFAMHLNDSFGKSKIKNIYNHHEQASIYSAIGYFKASNKDIEHNFRDLSINDDYVIV